MPYKNDGSDVPDSVPEDKRKQFAAVFNAMMDKMSDEGRAMAAAWSAIKKSFDEEDELAKAGARHSRSDMAMFDKVSAMMDEVKAMMMELRGQDKEEMDEVEMKKHKGEEVRKSMSLMGFFDKVKRAFEPTGPIDPNSNYCWVHDVVGGGALLDTQGEHYIAPFDFDGETVFPSDRSQWVAVEQEWEPKEAYTGIYKSDESKHLIYGVALKPEPFIDTQGDTLSKDEIEKAAHKYMEDFRNYDVQHNEDVESGKVVPVESYIAPTDIIYKGKFIPQGSWVVVSHVKDDTIWKSIKDGKINAYSIAGYAERREKLGE